jgi:hypothetical protein
VFPNTSQITVTTNPAGLQLTVDGQPFTAPHSFSSVVGFERPIAVDASQNPGSATYNFFSWSDGGARAHTISTPSTNTTYTANYAIAGDLDLDLDVDFNDAFTLSNNYGLQTGAVWSDGDTDHDGDVDFQDAFMQVNNYGVDAGATALQSGRDSTSTSSSFQADLFARNAYDPVENLAQQLADELQFAWQEDAISSDRLRFAGLIARRARLR